MTYGRVTDAMLMQEAASGKEDCFERLVRRHADKLLTFIERMVGDRHRSEELFQEVILVLWTHRHQYAFPRPFKPWLYAIALNRCRLYFRSACPPTVPLPGDLPVVGREPSPLDAAIAGETAESVKTAVARLPDAQRAVVVLRIWSRLSYAEIAEVTGRAEGTVRAYMHHAVNTLRTYLKPTIGA